MSSSTAERNSIVFFLPVTATQICDRCEEVLVGAEREIGSLVICCPALSST